MHTDEIITHPTSQTLKYELMNQIDLQEARKIMGDKTKQFFCKRNMAIKNQSQCKDDQQIVPHI
jgi:hypothetical protein